MDLDFLDEYRSFYSKKFEVHKKYCSRFHFFSCDIKKNDFPRLKDFEKDYLGYIVKRPLKAFIVGRTVLAPKVPDADKYFILCQDDFKPNLAGHELNVKGVAFLQQDSQVSVCATASLWMATKILSKKFEFRSYSPAEITAMATRDSVPFGRPIPSEALSSEQVCGALLEMGYEPKLHWPKSPGEAKEIIYRYVESELPVLLAMSMPGEPTEGHVVTVIGHTYRCIESPTKHGLLDEDRQEVGSYSLSSGWVDKFIVHDDRIGPYIELELLEDKQEYQRPIKIKHNDQVLKASLVEEYPCPIRMEYGEAGRKKEEMWNIDLIIVPLPPYIHITADNVKKNVTEFLGTARAHLAETSQLEDIVIRCYLRRSNEFKKKLHEKMNESLKCYYRGTCLPKYLWVVELSETKWMNEEKKENRLMKGEILIDPTASPYEHGIISAHLPGLLIYNYERHFERSDSKPLSEDVGYPHLAR